MNCPNCGTMECIILTQDGGSCGLCDHAWESGAFTVQLTPQAYAALERLKELSGKDTLEETISAALQVYLREPT